MLSDHGRGLAVHCWVGIERQGALEMDPRFSIPPHLGHRGRISLDASKRSNERELRDLLLGADRHFATRPRARQARA
jgi:predicted protein tyrosine phosphatase